MSGIGGPPFPSSEGLQLAQQEKKLKEEKEAEKWAKEVENRALELRLKTLQDGVDDLRGAGDQVGDTLGGMAVALAELTVKVGRLPSKSPSPLAAFASQTAASGTGSSGSGLTLAQRETMRGMPEKSNEATLKQTEFDNQKYTGMMCVVCYAYEAQFSCGNAETPHCICAHCKWNCIDATRVAAYNSQGGETRPAGEMKCPVCNVYIEQFKVLDLDTVTPDDASDLREHFRPDSQPPQ